MWPSQHNHKHNTAVAALNTAPSANTHSFTFDSGEILSPVQNETTPVFAFRSSTPQSKTRRGSRGSGSKASSDARATRSGAIVLTKEDLTARKKEERMEKERKAHDKKIDQAAAKSAKAKAELERLKLKAQ